MFKSFNSFFFRQIIIENLHLAGSDFSRIKESLYIIYSIRRFLCLDIKQTKFELRKVLFLTEGVALIMVKF